jgi:hypothetical protein
MSLRGIACVALALTGLAVGSAQGGLSHRSGCHTNHTCPSDHATYKWRGLWCVSPTADERNARFKMRVTFQGRTYFCHR